MAWSMLSKPTNYSDKAHETKALQFKYNELKQLHICVIKPLKDYLDKGGKTFYDFTREIGNNTIDFESEISTFIRQRDLKFIYRETNDEKDDWNDRMYKFVELYANLKTSIESLNGMTFDRTENQ